MTFFTPNLISFGMPGGWEWIIILVIALLIFGKKLPEVARSVGRSLTEFKKGVSEAKDSVEQSINDSSEEENQEPEKNSQTDQQDKSNQ